jgi:hypothetical protein
MLNASFLSPILRCVEQQLASIARFPSQIRLTLLVFLVATPMCWSQSAPAFNPIPSGGELSSTSANLSTSPAVITFQSKVYTVWCGYDNYIQSSFQTTPGATPIIYTSSIGCDSGNSGRLAVAEFVVPGVSDEVYVVGQPINYDTPYVTKILSSSDGYTWTENDLNLEYMGSADYTSQGYGLAVLGSNLYLAYLSSSTGTVSVASSSDGLNFYWVTTAATYSMVQNPSTWIQSPALYYWVNEYGQGDLYLGYLSTGGEIVVSYSHDGESWTSQVPSGTILKRDLMFASHNSALYFGGQSYYSADNLWMAGSYDGYNWPAATNYGGVIRTSPAAVDFGGKFYTVWVGCCNSHLYGYYTD